MNISFYFNLLLRLLEIFNYSWSSINSKINFIFDDFSEAWETLKYTFFGKSDRLLHTTENIVTTMPLPDLFDFLNVLKNNETLKKIKSVFFMLISKLIATLIIKLLNTIKNLIINKFKSIFIIVLSKATGIKYAMTFTNCIEAYINNKGLFKYLVHLVSTNNVPSILYNFNKNLLDYKIMQVLFLILLVFIDFNNYSTYITSVYLFFSLSISGAILWYVTSFDKDFYKNNPKLYILFTIFSYLFIFYFLYSIIIIIWLKLRELFSILKMMPWQGNNGSGSKGNSAGNGGNSGGPSSGGPNNSPGTFIHSKRKRKNDEEETHNNSKKRKEKIIARHPAVEAEIKRCENKLESIRAEAEKPQVLPKDQLINLESYYGDPVGPINDYLNKGYAEERRKEFEKETEKTNNYIKLLKKENSLEWYRKNLNDRLREVAWKKSLITKRIEALEKEESTFETGKPWKSVHEETVDSWLRRDRNEPNNVYKNR